MNQLVIIPARAGSKGVPGKNKKNLGGKPLITYTINAALACFDKSEICISTDDPEVVRIAEKNGIKPPFLRPDHLSTDTASSRDVILHALNYYKKMGATPTKIILLQPTSPFRNKQHIQRALQSWEEGMDMLVAVKESKVNPYFNLLEEDKSGQLVKSKPGTYLRRQDSPKVYEINGAIYIINPNSVENSEISEFRNISKFVMDEKSSHDIDTQLDWDLAEYFLQNE